MWNATFIRKPFLPLFSQFQRRKLSSSPPPPIYKEFKQRVLDVDVNCLETFGSSPNAPVIFFLPGALGSIEMDFLPILPSLNTKKYKWVSWDPPGFGKSRPPKRYYLTEGYASAFMVDAKYVKELMNMFGHQQYTCVAWSGSGHSAFLVASEQPEKVPGIIVWGGFGYVPMEAIPFFKIMKKMGLEAIAEGRRTPLIEMYGEKYLLELNNGWLDEAEVMAHSEVYKLGGQYQETLKQVKCPTLLIHGMKDALVRVENPKYMMKSLPNSKLHIMENATHSLHLFETKEFVKCIEEFVDQNVVRSRSGSN